MATVVFPEINEANNAITTLNGSINDSTTSVTLATGGAAALGFSGATTDAYITVIDATTWRKNPLTSPETLEIMQVTAVSGDTLTVTRGVDGTSGTAFADGSIVELRINAAMIQRIYDALTDGTDDIMVNRVDLASTNEFIYESGGYLRLAGATGVMQRPGDNIGTICTSTTFRPQANKGLQLGTTTYNWGHAYVDNLSVDGDLDAAGTVTCGTDSHTANANADNLVVAENAAQVGINILSNSTGNAQLYFGTVAGANGRGRIIYDNSPEEMSFYIAAGERAAITSTDATFSVDVNVPTKTPASASATGTTGTITWDSNYIYVCTATNTWKRVAISTW